MHNVDWKKVKSDIERQGYAIIPKALKDGDISSLLSECPQTTRFAFNKGQKLQQNISFYPSTVLQLREILYRNLFDLAAKWSSDYNGADVLPATLQEYDQQYTTENTMLSGIFYRHSDKDNGNKGHLYNFHQDLRRNFPFQALTVLNDASEYTDGQFLLRDSDDNKTIRRIKLGKGDMLIFPSRYRKINDPKEGQIFVKADHSLEAIKTPMLSKNKGQRISLPFMI